MSLYAEIARLQAAGEAAALCTIVRAHGSTPRRAGSKMLVYPDGHFSGTIGGGQMEHRVVQEALAALKDGQPRLLTYELTDPGRGDPGVCGGQLEVYVEPILPQATVVVYGAGHVGRAVVHLAKWLGMRVIAADDREGFTEAAPEADEHLTVAPAALAAALTITPQTYLVLTTRNVEVDLDALPPLLDSAAAYIGIIGSKRRWETARKQLMERGLPKEQLDRVVSPMGVEIHAETPEEIAVSIMGEIIARMRG
ncbi:MAG: XdhC family protein [Anaerolineae bacterium]|nr:MAG: XdhC family protein [Anaerolineae bacterium]